MRTGWTQKLHLKHRFCVIGLLVLIKEALLSVQLWESFSILKQISTCYQWRTLFSVWMFLQCWLLMIVFSKDFLPLRKFEVQWNITNIHPKKRTTIKRANLKPPLSTTTKHLPFCTGIKIVKLLLCLSLPTALRSAILP